MRAAAVGLDPWPLIDLSAPEDLAIAEHVVSRLEANALAKVDAQANATAYRVTEGIVAILEALGLVTRKRG